MEPDYAMSYGHYTDDDTDSPRSLSELIYRVDDEELDDRTDTTSIGYPPPSPPPSAPGPSEPGSPQSSSSDSDSSSHAPSDADRADLLFRNLITEWRPTVIPETIFRRCPTNGCVSLLWRRICRNDPQFNPDAYSDQATCEATACPDCQERDVCYCDEMCPYSPHTWPPGRRPVMPVGRAWDVDYLIDHFKYPLDMLANFLLVGYTTGPCDGTTDEFPEYNFSRSTLRAIANARASQMVRWPPRPGTYITPLPFDPFDHETPTEPEASASSSAPSAR